MLTRREFLISAAAGGTALLLPTRVWGPGTLAAAAQTLSQAVPGGTLDPTPISKFAQPLIIPPAMPRTSKLPTAGRKAIDYYEIAVRQFRQQILPAGLPATTVWSYGSVNHPGSFNYPAFTIEAKWTAPVRVKWMNQLIDANGNYLPHLLPIDQTLHWANPPGGPGGRDAEGLDPKRYMGPVPIVTHLHGRHSGQESDGFPEAWFLPAANNIPPGYATVGSYYDTFKTLAQGLYGQPWTQAAQFFSTTTIRLLRLCGTTTTRSG